MSNPDGSDVPSSEQKSSPRAAVQNHGSGRPEAAAAVSRDARNILSAMEILLGDLKPDTIAGLEAGGQGLYRAALHAVSRETAEAQRPAEAGAELHAPAADARTVAAAAAAELWRQWAPGVSHPWTLMGRKLTSAYAFGKSYDDHLFEFLCRMQFVHYALACRALPAHFDALSEAADRKVFEEADLRRGVVRFFVASSEVELAKRFLARVPARCLPPADGRFSQRVGGVSQETGEPSRRADAEWPAQAASHLGAILVGAIRARDEPLARWASGALLERCRGDIELFLFEMKDADARMHMIIVAKSTFDFVGGERFAECYAGLMCRASVGRLFEVSACMRQRPDAQFIISDSIRSATEEDLRELVRYGKADGYAQPSMLYWAPAAVIKTAAELVRSDGLRFADGEALRSARASRRGDGATQYKDPGHLMALPLHARDPEAFRAAKDLARAHAETHGPLAPTVCGADQAGSAEPPAPPAEREKFAKTLEGPGLLRHFNALYLEAPVVASPMDRAGVFWAMLRDADTLDGSRHPDAKIAELRSELAKGGGGGEKLEKIGTATLKLWNERWQRFLQSLGHVAAEAPPVGLVAAEALSDDVLPSPPGADTSRERVPAERETAQQQQPGESRTGSMLRMVRAILEYMEREDLPA